jgi:ABC-type lipoprotein release transport system permease subunit
MLMAIYERIRELGMMRAMGMRDSEVRNAFLLEAAGIGFIGSTLGIIIGSLANIPLTNGGIDLGSMMRDMDMGYRITGIMRGIWEIRTIAGAFLTGITLSVLVALVPTRRALKKEITDCLRYE